MDTFDYTVLGRRVKALRRQRRINQQEMAELLGKSLRTVQKYESGEIEVSIAVVNQMAEILKTTPQFLLGYEAREAPIHTLADIMSFFFEMEKASTLDFSIEINRPPHQREWTGAIKFAGKSANAESNADMCLFLEAWQNERESYRTYEHDLSAYNDWKEQNLSYYAVTPLDMVEPEELDEDERLKRRNAYLEEWSKRNQK